VEGACLVLRYGGGDGERNKNVAWYYPEPKEKASHIKDHVAFWNGVRVVETQATG